MTFARDGVEGRKMACAEVASVVEVIRYSVTAEPFPQTVILLPHRGQFMYLLRRFLPSITSAPAHQRTPLPPLESLPSIFYGLLGFNSLKVRTPRQIKPPGGPAPILQAAAFFPAPTRLILLALLLALSTTTIALHMTSSRPPSANASTM